MYLSNRTDLPTTKGQLHQRACVKCMKQLDQSFFGAFKGVFIETYALSQIEDIFGDQPV